MEPTHRQESIELMERADLMMVDGDSEEARELLSRAVEIDPGNREARRMLDGLLQRMNAGKVGQDNRGAHAAEEMADLIGAIVHARGTGQYELAHALCMRALAIDPESELVKAEIQSLRAVYPHVPPLPPSNPFASENVHW